MALERTGARTSVVTHGRERAQARESTQKDCKKARVAHARPNLTLAMVWAGSSVLN